LGANWATWQLQCVTLTTHDVRQFDNPFDHGTMAASQACHLLRRYRVHRPAGRRRPVPEREREHAPRFQKAEQLPQSSRTLSGGDVLPDTVEQDEIERQTQPLRREKRGQTIGQRPQSVLGVETSPSARIAAEGSTATTSWPSRASQTASRPVPAPTSRISAGGGRQQSIDPAMHRGRIERLVSRRDRGGVTIVPVDGLRNEDTGRTARGTAVGTKCADLHLVCNRKCGECQRHTKVILRWTPETGQVAKRESSLGAAGRPKVRHDQYSEETQS
jgi:hypothetical protein